VLFFKLRSIRRRATEDALTDSSYNALNRREFIHGALAGAAFAALPMSAFSEDNSDLHSVLSQIPKMHDENVKTLQNWIALPSIAAENRNYPQTSGVRPLRVSFSDNENFENKANGATLASPRGFLIR
jgi:hypothetical protein